MISRRLSPGHDGADLLVRSQIDMAMVLKMLRITMTAMMILRTKNCRSYRSTVLL